MPKHLLMRLSVNNRWAFNALTSIFAASDTTGWKMTKNVTSTCVGCFKFIFLGNALFLGLFKNRPKNATTTKMPAIKNQMRISTYFYCSDGYNVAKCFYDSSLQLPSTSSSFRVAREIKISDNACLAFSGK